MQKKTRCTARRTKSLANTPADVGSIITDDDGTLVGALKIHAAAHYLALSPPTVRRLVANGLLRPMRQTRHLIFSVAELNRFMREGMVE
jgi:excisionase family DNA binding protein